MRKKTNSMMTAAKLGVAVGAIMAAMPAKAADNTIRIISLNTWGASSLNPTALDLFTGGKYDVITIQEYNTNYGNDIEAKLPPYAKFANGDTGLASALPVTTGLGGVQKTPYMKLGAEGGRPTTIVATEHLNYWDDPFDHRVREAKELNDWAKSEINPILITGDFNAGDVSERGLLEVPQQELLLTRARETQNADYKAWALQYVARNHPIGSEKYKAAEDYINKTSDSRPTDLFTDELYPIKGNTPNTLNILKKDYQLLQNPEDREKFAPHELADGSTTWPSIGEDDEAFKWPSWGRTQIDHFMASRPYAKWWKLVDQPGDKYVGGVLDPSVTVGPDGKPLSDHEAVAHDIAWMGPRVIETADGKAGLIFDNEASGFDGAGEFKLSRNNNRTDVYLGQLSDENGVPIYRRPEMVQPISQQDLALLVSYAIYDRHDTAPYLAQLRTFVPSDKMEIFDKRVAELLVGAETRNAAFRKVIDDYFQAHRDEFPGVSAYDKLEWEDWGNILIKYLKADLTFQTVPTDTATPAWNELRAALGLDDPAERARLSKLTGLDFENDPYAPLKLQLSCLDAKHLSLQGAKDLCVDDHSRFKDIAITDGKTVAIDESEALGSADGTIILANGGIRTAGPDEKWASWTGPVTKIDKAVRLEGLGWIDVSHPTVPVDMMKAISGKGTFEKRGAGTLNLMAANSYTGGIIVTEGTLRAGVKGAFVDDTAYAVNGGTLDLGGFDLTMSLLTGAGLVKTGGASLDVDTLAPGGDDIGTLTVDGDLTLGAGSTYIANIAPDGKGDKLAVTGTAMLQGGDIYIAKLAGNYMPGQRYTILTAGEGVTGTFGNLSQNMPFVDLGLTYDPRNVYLDIARNDVAFPTVGITRNQKATAGAVEALDAGNDVYDAVVLQDSEAAARVAFDQLSGEIHASARTALINDSRLIRSAVNDRLRAAFNDVAASDVPVMGFGPDAKPLVKGETPQMAAWGQAFGAWSKTKSDGNAADLDQSTGGFITGFDAAVATDWRLGAFAGYSRTTFDAKGSGESDNYHAGVYGGGHFGALSVRSGLGYSWHSVETSRVVAFPGFEDRLKADYDAGTFQAFGELGYRIDMKQIAFEPFANLAHVRVKTDSFTETGGAAALSAAEETTSTTFTTLGLRASAPFTLGTVEAEARGTVGWQHAYGDTTPVSTLAFDGGNGFTVAGVPLAEDMGLVEAGFDVKLSERTTLGISYTGQFGSDVQQNGVDARFAVKF
ncbi:autotransporter domain-containing protein [Brucella sp. IR073]|uniref:autotransporter domain-containing protein n=1 Tax=unclassified Brucella TaxID=2632610 RepID=UPI003B987A12